MLPAGHRPLVTFHLPLDASKFATALMAAVALDPDAALTNSEDGATVTISAPEEPGGAHEPGDRLAEAAEVLLVVVELEAVEADELPALSERPR